nr:1972_t:CDS:2 [Entrophospora candida]
MSSITSSSSSSSINEISSENNLENSNNNNKEDEIIESKDKNESKDTNNIESINKSKDTNNIEDNENAEEEDEGKLKLQTKRENEINLNEQLNNSPSSPSSSNSSNSSNSLSPSPSSSNSSISPSPNEELTPDEKRQRAAADHGLISDIESDCSIDLDELIAQTSDLDAGGGVNLGDDVDDLCDDSEDFWKIDPSELARHLTPSTTPLRGPSPNFNSARPVSIIAEEEESLSDTPLEIDNQEADDLWKTSNNEDNIFDIYCGKSGIPAGMSKSAFFGHFGISPLTPLSPTSSQASSTADPDELFETMSNGSTRSAASTSSRGTITGSGTRKPSNTLGIRAPSRIDH